MSRFVFDDIFFFSPFQHILWVYNESIHMNDGVLVPLTCYVGANSGDKNISVLHLSCRTSDLQFSLFLQTHSPSFKRICNKEHKGVICNMNSSSNSSQSTRPTGRELWGKLLIFSRFHS